MASFALVERSDGTIYLKCRCGEINQPCEYRGDVNFAGEGFTLMRQAKREAYDHCWHEHHVPAYLVTFDISRNTTQEEIPAALGPFLLTTKPLEAEKPKQQQKKAGA